MSQSHCALSKRLCAVLQTLNEPVSLRELSHRLGCTPQQAEQAVQLGIRHGYIRRHHQDNGSLLYGWQASRTTVRPSESRPPRRHTLTHHVMQVLRAHRAPLTRAEIMVLAGLHQSHKNWSSRISALLCMLSKRGKIQRVHLDATHVAFTCGETARGTASPVPHATLRQAGFLPYLPNKGIAQS